MLTPRSLSFYGRYAFRRQLPAEILVTTGAETALYGIFLLVRLFQPSALDTTLLFISQHLLFLTAPWVSERLRAQPTRRGFEFALMVGFPALLLAWFAEGFWQLGPLLVLANFGFVTVMVPPRNRMMRANYGAAERGFCYGRSKSIGSGTFFGFALMGAIALTHQPDHIYWMLPLVGASSACGLLLYRRIRVRHERRSIAAARALPRRGFVEVYRDLFRLFRAERPFLAFQIGFMIYGFAFMASIPREIDAVGTILEASPVLIVLGVNGMTPLAKILCVSFFGRLLDRRGPTGTAAISFALLALQPLVIWAAIGAGSLPLWFLGRAAFGAAMAGVDVCWSMGPIAYGGRERAAAFSAAHIFAVGIRALVFPMLGYAIHALVGNALFGICALVFLGAGLFMARQPRPEIEST
ncbi:MAG: hypothetical protein H6807_10030 [Planctomycetes bacterium]|nr:hypothetical protein [Planctomycetota bacterium]